MRSLAFACGLVLVLQSSMLASGSAGQDKTIRLEGDGRLGTAAAEHRGTSSEYGYEGTPPSVIPAMLDLAAVSGDDVVYEPGCGDARILIAAVQAGARRGLGVDIDPDLAEVAWAKVRAAGLADKIEIRWGNALSVDMFQATVVVLFMGEPFNLVMRPMLWKQLPVGARVVSNDFGMGDWKPDKTVRVDTPGRSYVLYLWMITQELKDRADAYLPGSTAIAGHTSNAAGQDASVAERTCPSPVRRSRSCATGGRSAYRHSRSRRCRWPAGTTMPAWRSKPCWRA